jgi:hypothetical protein
MSTFHTATAVLVGEPGRQHVVVTQADPVIWLSPELVAEALDPARTRVPGDLEITGDQPGDWLTFGTRGEGLGRLAYRITGRHPDGWYVAEQVTNQPASGPPQPPSQPASPGPYGPGSGRSNST